MHVLVATGIFHPDAGGPATYLYHFLPELQARGHTVEVVTFGSPTDHPYPYPVTRIHGVFFQRHWAYYRAVQARLPKADRVFINSLGIPLPRISKPSILKIVGDRAWERCVNRGLIPPTEDIDHFQTQRYHPLIEWIKRSRSQEAQRADRIIVPSEYLRRMVMGWGVPAERITVIYNAFESQQAQKCTRADLKLPNKPLLLVVARLTAWKGVDALLEAMHDLPDVHLVVAGTGPMFETWQRLARELGLGSRVRFLGNLPQADLQPYYALADYTVLYSGYEGLSHVILESLNAGTPVIASDKGGNPEVVRDGENGWLVPYKNVDALRSALRRAFEGDTPQRLRRSAAVDPERFKWANLVQQTITVLEETGA